MKRLQLAAGVMLVYWLMLVGGLALFTFNRIEDAAALQGIWLGLLIGTGLGHLLALRDVRFAVAFLAILLGACWMVAVVPPEVAGGSFAKTMVAAGLCAFWSLGDRSSLAAFWFPTMIWMLSILDRTTDAVMPDRIGVVLLGGLALMFVAFLRVRESRRLQLWKTVGFARIAAARPASVLKEHPGGRIARASWSLLVGSSAFAVTAWLAPQLWQTERVDGDPIAIRMPRDGLPCCPTSDSAPTQRSRVKEYLDLGRGHDAIDPDRAPVPGRDCQPCGGGGGSTELALGGGTYSDSYPIDVTGRATSGTGSVLTSGSYIPGTDGTAAPAPGTWSTPAVSTTPPPVALPPAPITLAPAQVTPAVVPVSPPPLPPSPRAAVPPPSQTPTPSSASSIASSEPALTIAPHQRSTGLGASLLHWVLVFLACALVLQLVAVALRPLRRAITLRHLRRPFWSETVDQRISNSWQLALIGLRDAGWRSSSTESPREFAQRVQVDGLECCATILERARHGLGVDAADLAEMSESADAAYRTARAPIGKVSRVAAAIRWPLA